VPADGACGTPAASGRVEVQSPRGWLGRVALVAVVVWALFGVTVRAAIEDGDGRWYDAVLAAAAFVLGSALVVGIGRVLRARPLIELADEALVVHDSRLFYREFSVLRSEVRDAVVLDLPRPRIGRGEFGLSPCAEPWNLRITFTAPVLCLVARSGPWGSWFWPWVLAGEAALMRPPRRLHPYGGMLVRAADPERAQRQITAWTRRTS
jgi:hypothetical protein